MADIIQIRRDTAANWTAANPILAQGEPALEIDTKKEKIGDGITAWNSLPYKSNGSTIGKGDIYYADDYENLQGAIDVMPSTGGVLWLSAKEYILTDSLIVDKPITILGVSASDLEMLSHVTSISTTSGTIDMIEFAHENIIMKNVSLINKHSLPTAGSGLKITSGITSTGTPTPYPSGFKLDNVMVKGFYININIVNAYHWHINNLTSYKAVLYGLFIQNQQNPDGGDACLSNSWIYAGGRNSWAGIHHVSGGGLKMINVKFNSTGGLSGGSGERLQRCYNCDFSSVSSVLNISNCSFENYSIVGIKILNNAYITITGCQFSSYYSTGWGVYLGTVNTASVIGNVYYLTGSSIGIEVVSSSNITLLNAYRNAGTGARVVNSSNTNFLNLNP